MGKAIDIYGGRDPRDVPLYGFAEAADLLRVPTSTLRSWTVGQDYKTTRGRRRFLPPVPLARGHGQLTFYNLVEAYVLAAMRRNFNVALPMIRTAVDYVRTEMHEERPLLREDFYTDGVSLLVERSGAFVNASHGGQLAIARVIQDSLKRVERDAAGLAARLYPWRTNIEEPKFIEIDPTRAFGKPIVAGTSIAVEVMRSRYRAGDGVDRLAKDYKLDRGKVLAVVEWNGAAA